MARNKLNQMAFPVPRGPGNFREEPDGVTSPDGVNALRDTQWHPDNFNPDEDPTVRRPEHQAPKGTRTGWRRGF